MLNVPALSPKQRRFVDEYLVDCNGARAAVAAGYSARSARAIAFELLTKPDVQTVLRGHQAADAVRLRLTRDRVVAGLLEAVEQARARQEPMAMVAALREIGRMMGYYTPERVQRP